MLPLCAVVPTSAALQACLFTRCCVAQGLARQTSRGHRVSSRGSPSLSIHHQRGQPGDSWHGHLRDVSSGWPEGQAFRPSREGSRASPRTVPAISSVPQPGIQGQEMHFQGEKAKFIYAKFSSKLCPPSLFLPRLHWRTER